MDDDSNDFEDEYVEEESEAYVSLSSRDCCLLYLLQFTLNDFLIILCLNSEGWRWRCWRWNISCWDLVG